MSISSDFSSRYVLPADAPYVANLAALWAMAPKFAAALESTDGRASYAIAPSRTGPPTLVVNTPDGRHVHLHSQRDPLVEARRLIESLKLDEHVIFYLHGLGLGYHLDLLFEQASDEAIFFIFEPDLILLRTTLETRNLSRLIESNRVRFFWESDKAELFHRLAPCNAMLSMGAVTVIHPASQQLQPEYHTQLMQWLGDFDEFNRTSINTLLLNGRRTAENIACNAGWYSQTPGLARLQQRYAGKPAIIVSAGPSLRKNKHLLKDAQSKAVLIAVQTTLQPLLEMGIEPQFVTSLDYHEICTRFFERLPATLRTELIAEPKATCDIFKMNPGPITLLGNAFADDLLHELKLSKPRLRAGATVAHLAYYLAEYLGCNPIVFVGQDLGFSDGLCYTPGTSYEDVWRPELSAFCSVEMKNWEQIARDRPILRQIPDFEHRPMYTEERLYTYLQQFERDFAGTRTTIIDATEGGALKQGATIMPLEEVIATYCNQPLPRQPDDYPGLQPAFLEASLQSLRNRRDEAVQIEQIGQQTLPLLEQVLTCLQDQAQVNRLIASIDALRSRMDTFGRCYDLIMQLTQQTELERFKRDRLVTASKATGVERQRRQVQRDIENVKGVIAAAKTFEKLMNESSAIVSGQITGLNLSRKVAA